MRLITRRAFLGFLGSLWDSRPPSAAVREYRASAQVRLFGMTLFSVQNVGGARATYESHWTNSGLSHRLSFAAGSDPARARGLNRLGAIRETVCSDPGEILATEYLGFMTASREESLDEARAALAAASQPLAPFAAIEGRCDQQNYRVASAAFMAPTPRDWSQYRLIEPLAAHACRCAAAVTQRPVSGASATFLYSLMQVIHDPQPSTLHAFSYSKDLYWLRADRAADVQTGRQLAARGLTASREKICRISCKVRNQKSGKVSSFSLWVETEGACWLPLRFECRPKSYLSLVFDALPSARPDDGAPEALATRTPESCLTEGAR